MQFNIIFKTIFEYIHKKFLFVHTNTFCKYRKKLRASPRVHLVVKAMTNLQSRKMTIIGVFLILLLCVHRAMLIKQYRCRASFTNMTFIRSIRFMDKCLQ